MPALVKGLKQHGHTQRIGDRVILSPTYLSYRCMRNRCEYPANASYYAYGARGITVCDRWKDFRAFLADMGERPPGHTLDRKDNTKGYSPDNCRWATPKQQRWNQGPR